MNQIVRDVMIEKIRQAQKYSEIVQDVPHIGFRGQLRETILSKVLEPWLPRGVELGTGFLIDESGSKRPSNEDDIIIYSPDLLPTMLPFIDRNIFLLDSVLVHIEVKTTLTSSELLKSLENAIAIGNLKTSYEGGREIKVIYAYHSDINSSELVRIKKHLFDLGWKKKDPPISFICVDNKECLMHGKVHVGKEPKKPGKWYDLVPGKPLDSTLAFVSSLVSSLNKIRYQREFVQLARFVYDTNGTKIVD